MAISASRASEYRAPAEEPMHLLRVGDSMLYHEIVGIAIYKMNIIDRKPVTQSAILEFIEANNLTLGETHSDRLVWACLGAIKLHNLDYLANVVDKKTGKWVRAQDGARPDPLLYLTKEGIERFSKLYEALEAGTSPEYLPSL
jgi:hypothetical protein